MKSAAKSARVPYSDAELQLDTFIAKFEPKLQTLLRAVRKAMRKPLPNRQRTRL